MLVMLYGSFGEIHKKSRSFFEESGFVYIEKISYSDSEEAYESPAGKRQFVTKEYFEENTDSLFRYEVNGFHVGFRQEQVIDAVSGKCNGFLPITTTDMTILSEIRRIYGDSVLLVFCYVEDKEVERRYHQYDIPYESRMKRIQVGKEIKKCYAEHSELFDRVVLYSGEGTVFDFRSLMLQYRQIIESLTDHKAVSLGKYDVFISYAHEDIEKAREIYQVLSDKDIVTFFDEESIRAGDNLSDVLNEVIAKSKITVVVVSSRLLDNPSAVREVKEVIDAAENGGTIVIPYFTENVDCDRLEEEELYMLELVHCVDESRIDNAVNALADMVGMLLHGSEELKSLAFQVENYLSLGEYEMAKLIQTDHLELSIRLCDLSRETFVTAKSVVYSYVKMIDILICLEEWESALDHITEALEYLCYDDDCQFDFRLESVFSKQLAVCVAKLGMTPEDVESFADRFVPSVCDELLYLYRNTEIVDESVPSGSTSVSGLTPAGSTVPAEPGAEQIVTHAQSVIETFYDLLEKELSQNNIVGLITGYERVLRFCKYMNICGDVAVNCVKRIAQLQGVTGNDAAPSSESISEGLSIYLGNTIPQSGDYDVFISYKSEDIDLAEKVYDFLADNGKVVFFAPRSLPRLKTSEYETEIYNAMDHSKHMLLVGTDPEYFKTKWLTKEWMFFESEISEGRKEGKLIIVLSDRYISDKGKLPPQLRGLSIVPTGRFRTDLLAHLW